MRTTGLLPSFKRAAAAVLCVSLAVSPSAAFNQPPVNLGTTSFLDGGGGAPGLIFVQYLQFSRGGTAVDHAGSRISGGAQINSLVSLTQLIYMSSMTVSGAHPGLHAIFPLVSVSAKGSLGPAPLTANTAGPGDLVAGPFLQWNGTLQLVHHF